MKEEIIWRRVSDHQPPIRKGGQILCRWCDDWNDRYIYAVAVYSTEDAEWVLSEESLVGNVYGEFEQEIDEWCVLW